LGPLDIKSNLEIVRARIARACQRSGRSIEDITLIGVTKTEKAEVIRQAHDLGLRDFGENRVMEAADKIKSLADLQPRPTWHMIGHLQTNKLRTALEFFDLIQSVDSVHLAGAINKSIENKIPVFLQVNVSGEASKSGFSLADFPGAFELISKMPGLEIKGLMTIAPQAENAEEVRPIFRKLNRLKETCHLKDLSMGMTHDFEVAIEEGATLIRVGRAIFGERN
jgi:PLP dependent protein